MRTKWPICERCGKSILTHALVGLRAFCGAKDGPRSRSFTDLQVYDARVVSGMRVTASQAHKVGR